MRLRLNDQAVLYIEFMVEQHPEKHSSFLPFLCQRYAITGALQLSTTFLQLLLEIRRHQTGQNEGQIRVFYADLPFFAIFTLAPNYP